MKTLLFIFAVLFATARPAAAQTVIRSATVAQVRFDKVNIPGIGRQAMAFVDATGADGKTYLLLLDAKAPLRAGDKLRIVDGHNIPRYVLIDGSGLRWYCFMDRYLKR